MSVVARILTVALLAVYLAGSVAYAASGSAMTAAMAMSDASGMNSTDCEGCGADGGAMPFCDAVCSSGFTALIGDHAVHSSPVMAEDFATNARNIFGRSGPPDPSPPRSIILS